MTAPTDTQIEASAGALETQAPTIRTGSTSSVYAQAITTDAIASHSPATIKAIASF